jgi:uncharacterized membrane protein (DUF485 family)
VSGSVDREAEATGAATHLSLQGSPEFRELRSRFRRFVFPMTAAFLVWYLLYVIASAWARDFMGRTIVGNINIGLVFGVLQFVSTFLIAWAYSRHAERKLDPIADKLRHEVEERTQ